MLDVLGEDYIRTARAKGLASAGSCYRHGLRSAVTPVVTQFGIDLGTLLGGVIIVENIFGLPGLGQLAVQSVTTQDLPVIIGTVVWPRRSSSPRTSSSTSATRSSTRGCESTRWRTAQDLSRRPGFVLTEHEFSVPLDHDRPDGRSEGLRAREIGEPVDDDRPLLVFFQGRPRVRGREADPALRSIRTWLSGRSGRLPGADLARPARHAASLDARRRPCPDCRRQGRPPTSRTSGPTRSSATPSRSDVSSASSQWSVLGQSFGGFCVTTTCRPRS